MKKSNKIEHLDAFEKLGIEKDKINSMKNISIYDELILNPDLSKTEN